MANSHSTMKRFCALALFGPMLSTAAVPMSAQAQAPAPVVDLDKLAARGEILGVADPLSAQLRERLDAAGQRGFDIGMGIAEGHTAPGPGKQAAGEALPADQQAGYFSAVLYSVTRNANLDALLTGGRVAQGNPALTDARRAENDPFYTLGFDIATGLLYNQPDGLSGASQTIGASKVRESLSGATQRGFDASATLNGRNFVSKSSSSTALLTPPGEGTTTDGTEGLDRVGSVPEVAGLIASDAEAALQKAGYKFTEVTVKGKPTRPPFDVVVGTVPPARTTLVAGSNVRYQTVDAVILNDIGIVNPESSFPRLAGFDLDTGKNALIDDGVDIFGSKTVVVCDPNVPYNAVPCRGGERILEVRNGAVMAKLGSDQWHAVKGFESFASYPLKSRYYFSACALALAGSTTKSLNIDALFNDGYSFVCVRTAEGHLSVVKFAPHDSTGNYQFEHALFPDYPVVKAQGRVKLGGTPSALSQLSICEKAKVARDRNSPAAPGLTKQCLESGGTVPQ